MKHTLKEITGMAVVGVATLLGAQAQTTAFTYQGKLNNGTNVANGRYDLTFRVDATSGAGVPVSSTITNLSVPVTNGLFTLILDFGTDPGTFPGNDRWLEIGVRTNGSGAFAILSPRQQFTSTPYAIRAASVTGGGLSGTYSNAVTLNNAANSFAGSGAGLTALNASQLTGGQVPAVVLSNAWKTTGNSGTTPGTHFLGTTDNQPLEIKVNGLRALRIEPNTSGAPNLIGGSPRNFAAAGIVGTTIAGGGATNYLGNAFTNAVFADSGTIGGGDGNTILPDAYDATIGGGIVNSIQNGAYESALGGGYQNTIQTNAYSSTIGGGSQNTIQTEAHESTIGGGYQNTIQTVAYDSAIGGGSGNRIQTNAYLSTIGGGSQNTIQSNAGQSTIGGGSRNNIAANSSAATIAGGISNSIGVLSSSGTVSGGNNNQANGSSSTVVGGDSNVAAGPSSCVVGGSHNTASGDRSTAMGTFTTASGFISTAIGNSTTATGDNAIAMGFQSTASGYDSIAAGTRAKADHAGTFVWGDSTYSDFASTGNDQFLIRASGGVGIGLTNPAAQLHVSSSNSLTLQLNQQNVLDYSRMRMIVGNGLPYWDVASKSNRFVIYSSQLNADMIQLDTNGLTVHGTFVSASDRNLKENFTPVDSKAVLERVAALPLSEWNYKQDTGSRHIGPMAQDFYAAFNVGPDDRHIATVDADGVALAAIQGLNQKLEEKNVEVAKLRSELAELKKAVAELRGH